MNEKSSSKCLSESKLIERYTLELENIFKDPNYTPLDRYIHDKIGRHHKSQVDDLYNQGKPQPQFSDRAKNNRRFRQQLDIDAVKKAGEDKKTYDDWGLIGLALKRVFKNKD